MNGIEKVAEVHSTKCDELQVGISQCENKTNNLTKRLQKIAQSEADAEINKLEQEVKALEFFTWQTKI